MPPEATLASIPHSLQQDTFQLVDRQSIIRMSRKFTNPEDLLREAKDEEDRLYALSHKHRADISHERLQYLRDLFGAAFLYLRRQKSGEPLPIDDDLKRPRDTTNAPYGRPLRIITELISARQQA